MTLGQVAVSDWGRLHFLLGEEAWGTCSQPKLVLAKDPLLIHVWFPGHSLHKGMFLLGLQKIASHW